MDKVTLNIFTPTQNGQDTYNWFGQFSRRISQNLRCAPVRLFSAVSTVPAASFYPGPLDLADLERYLSLGGVGLTFVYIPEIGNIIKVQDGGNAAAIT